MAPLPKVQCIWLLACAGAVPFSLWEAAYPANSWLQVGPVLLGLPLAWWALRRWPFSNASVGWGCAFVLLHLFAARWTYSSVPYDAWGQAVFGVSIDASFGFDRNMFDRLVHFASGLFLAGPVAEGFRRYGRLSHAMALFVAVLSIVALGAVYEIFEWLLTIGLSPADAAQYNGQQGDMFDAPKDMAMATVGALAALIWLRHPGSGQPQSD